MTRKHHVTDQQAAEVAEIVVEQLKACGFAAAVFAPKGYQALSVEVWLNNRRISASEVERALDYTIDRRYIRDTNKPGVLEIFTWEMLADGIEIADDNSTDESRAKKLYEDHSCFYWH
ncbi:MAG: hypothetical protein JW910_18040 [Anaerolineae bacterium]|nr:hypothetical protein [Anaerolineae bacterium]